MTCPKCGATTELYPCPVCGFQPEQPCEEELLAARRHRFRGARMLALVLCTVLVLGLGVFGVSRWLFSGDWQEPDVQPGPETPPVSQQPATVPNPNPTPNPDPAPTPDPAPVPEPEPEPIPPRYTVVIDPGHGGTQQPGVVAGTLCEKEINLQVACKLRDLLEQDNIRVIMTRTEDVYMKLGPRIDMANEIAADCFLSIHCNSFDNPKVRGFEVFYYKSDAGEEMAESMRKAAELLGIRTRECKSGNYQVLRDADVPAALAEIGYFTCPEELALLRDDSYQQLIAQALRDGMLNYLDKEP